MDPERCASYGVGNVHIEGWIDRYHNLTKPRKPARFIDRVTVTRKDSVSVHGRFWNHNPDETKVFSRSNLRATIEINFDGSHWSAIVEGKVLEDTYSPLFTERTRNVALTSPISLITEPSERSYVFIIQPSCKVSSKELIRIST